MAVVRLPYVSASGEVLVICYYTIFVMGKTLDAIAIIFKYIV